MALTLLATNNAESTLASAISATDTSLIVSAGTGAEFPDAVAGESYFKLTITDAATGSQVEIVNVTAKAGDIFTIERAQEGTLARAWAANDMVANMMTADTLNVIADFAKQASDSAEEAQGYALSASEFGDNKSTFADTTAGLAATTSGQYFRVPQGVGNVLAFRYYKNNSGVAQEVAEYPGQGSITNTIREFPTLAAAQADADAGNIMVGSTAYYRSPDDSALAIEVINNAGTLQPTGRKMPSQQSVDESHKNVLGYLTDALPNLYRFKTIHCQTAPSAQADSVASSWFIFPDVLPAGLISKVELAVSAAGKIYVATFSKAGTVFTRKQVKSFDVEAGSVSLTPEMLADDGDYIGVYTEGGLYFNTAATITGTVYRWASTVPAGDTTLDTSTATGTYSYTFQVRVTALRGNALSIATDALNTQLIGMASRFDNLSAISRAGDGNRMFMLNTPVKFDGVVTGVTWLANNSGGGSQTVRAMAYRLSGSTYTLVDSQVVTASPADNSVTVLPLYLSVKAGDFLVFSAPVCFDSLINFGVNFADTAYSIYSPSDSTIPTSIPSSSFAAQT
ncbi:TPA: hypothetical protein ACILGH_002365, partial [Escherichia coli]